MHLPIDERSSLDEHMKAELVKSIHERVQLQIAQKNEKFDSQVNKGRRCDIFEAWDWVWVHMCKERFPSHRMTKLHPRGDGPFQILEKINDNAYKVDLSMSIMSLLLSMILIFLLMIQVTIRGQILLRRGGMVGTMVDRILKIPCKFQMGQSQGQERRRLRKQYKDWCNSLGPSLQIYRARPQNSRWAWKNKNQL
jgi:hypothetical protein